MELYLLPDEFSICKLHTADQADLTADYCFFSKTDEELSLVCPTDRAPQSPLERDDSWRGFRIQGVLVFSLIGILAKLSTVLAANGVGLFAVSTYNTDYLFVKAEQLPTALGALTAEGYQFV